MDDQNENINENINVQNDQNEEFIRGGEDGNINVLMPLMIIESDEVKKDKLTDDGNIKRNIKHTNWVNANYKRLHLELLNNIRNKDGSGMFVVHKFNVNNKYTSYWTNKEKFKKMRLAEKEKNQIVELLERSDQTSIIVFFCDMGENTVNISSNLSIMTLYKI